MKHLEKLDVKKDRGIYPTDEERWKEIIEDYETTKANWNTPAFGYLTFENFLRYNYQPPVKKFNR